MVEGLNDVAASSTAKDISDLVLLHMKPKLEIETNWFPFDWKAMAIREIGGGGWDNLVLGDQTKPYLYARCLVESRGKDKKLVFKKPPRPFTFALVIDAKEWIRYTNFLDAKQVCCSL